MAKLVVVEPPFRIYSSHDFLTQRLDYVIPNHERSTFRMLWPSTFPIALRRNEAACMPSWWDKANARAGISVHSMQVINQEMHHG